MNMNVKPLSIAILLLLSGCQSLSDYQRPATNLPDQYRTQDALGSQTTSVVNNAPDWWQPLISIQLQQALNEAIHNNLSLQASEKALAQANAFYQAQQAGFNTPKVDATVTGQTLRANPSSLGQQGAGREFELYQVGLTAKYQFDLSGSQQQTLKALAAKTDYQHWQLRANQHNLIGQWLLTAVLIAKADAQSQATQDIIALQAQQLSIAQQREKLGIGQEIDVIALQTQLAQTQSTLPALIKQQQQLTHLLAALSGSSASTLSLSTIQLSDFVLPTTQALTLPSQLIQQRPDILASEALVKAAHAEHGLSLTRYYPNITLSASTGSQALTTAALCGSGTAIWSLMTQVTQPLFDASLPEQERAALLGFEAASLRYQQVVIDAMRQVADSLSAIEQDQHTLTHLNQAEKSAQLLITITDKQYQLGTASYLQLLSAQQQLALIRLQRIQLNAQQLINHINLALALGR